LLLTTYYNCSSATKVLAFRFFGFYIIHLFTPKKKTITPTPWQTPNKPKLNTYITSYPKHLRFKGFNVVQIGFRVSS
jgi:hypothetical protein